MRYTNSPKTVYLACRKHRDNLEILGCFDTPVRAELCCTEYNDFVGPLPFNQYLGNTRVEWPDCYYPNWEK